MGLDETMRALSDPTRREILRRLRDGDMTAGEIGALFPITAASTSHHLAVLKEADLVQARREGRSVVYSLDATVMQELMEELLAYFRVGGAR
jgi:DNA-binding transcriptional ArsR family regulator